MHRGMHRESARLMHEMSQKRSSRRGGTGRWRQHVAQHVWLLPNLFFATLDLGSSPSFRETVCSLRRPFLFDLFRLGKEVNQNPRLKHAEANQQRSTNRNKSERKSEKGPKVAERKRAKCPAFWPSVQMCIVKIAWHIFHNEVSGLLTPNSVLQCRFLPSSCGSRPC